MNHNGNLSYRNLWNVAKAVLTGKLKTLKTFTRKQKQSKINYAWIHLGKLDKEDQSKAKGRKKKEITKRAETNEIKNRQQRKKNQKLSF